MKKSLSLGIFFILTLNLFAQLPCIQWQKSLGGTGTDNLAAIRQTTDGGYIFASTTNSIDGNVSGNHGLTDIWVVKLNSTGTIVWQRCLGGSNTELAHDIRQTTDGGYVVAGRTQSNDGDVTGNHGSMDGWIVKLDANGNITWQKTLGNGTYDASNAIQQTTDGGYIVAGHVDGGYIPGAHNVGTEAWLAKLDAIGNVVWQKVYGGSQSDGFYSVYQTSDGGYVASNITYSPDGDVTGHHGSADAFIVKVNSVGTIQWTKSFGGTGIDYSNSIQQTSDGGYIVGAVTESINGNVTSNHGGSDLWAIKLNSSGTIVWQKSIGGTGNEGGGILQDGNGEYVISATTNSNNGDVSGNHGMDDGWVAKLDASGNLLWQKTFGGSNADGVGLQLTTNAGYILGGASASNDGDVSGNHGGNDVWVVKLATPASLELCNGIDDNCDGLIDNIAVTTNGGSGLAATYPTLAAAITALNAASITSPVVISQNGPETAPAGGYIITAQGTATNTITIQGGSCSQITANSSHTVGLVSDGIFKLIGADYVTIQNFTMQENPANTVSTPTSSNTMTEWGVALLYASTSNGSQNNTIQNNTISLNRTYSNTFGIYSNTRHTATSVTASVDIINATTGPNKNNRIYGNNISNVNTGVVFIGSATGTNIDSGNDIGGTSGVTGNTITNWGGAAPASGYVSVSGTSSNCIYINNQIGYNVSYNTLVSAAVTPAVTFRGIMHDITGQVPTVLTTINITNNSITMTSGQTSGTFRAIATNTAASPYHLNINNNIIQNCAITGASSATTLEGIIHTGNISSLSISGNIFKNNNSSAVTGGFIAIQNFGNITGSININNNQVGNNSGGAITFSAVTTSNQLIIQNSAGAATASLSINGNNFQGINHSVNVSSHVTFIQNTIPFPSLSISNNTFTNLNIKSSGIVTFIGNSVTLPANGVANINNNSIVTAFNKSVSGNNVYFYYNASQSGGVNSVENALNNNFSNVSIGNSYLLGWFNDAITTQKNIQGNTFSNITSTSTATSTILRCENGGNNNQITGNTISNINFGGGLYNIASVTNGSQTSCVYTISNNNVNNITIASGSTAFVYGIYFSGYSTNAFNNTIHTFSTTLSAGNDETRGISGSAITSLIIGKNKIYNLTANGISGVVFGIQALTNSTTTGSISNNMIGDLRSPNANGGFVNGIEVTGSATNLGIFYNSIYLNASSTGASFTSYGMHISGGMPVRNNIIVNLSTPGSSGRTYALRMNSSTYNAASNNNILYAGTPSASRVICHDNQTATTYITLSAFKALVAPRDANSYTENVPFLSTSGSSPDFLHINPAIATLAESRAVNITGFTDDFDSQPRQGNPGYAGSSTLGPDIGADEGEFITPPMISYTPLGLTCSSGDRILSGVQIKDDSSIPTSGSLVPRIYYRKNNGSYFSQPGTLVSGSATNGMWDFTIVAADMGGIGGVDTIRYYVIAQDNDAVPNVISEPIGVVAPNVNSVTTHPADVNFYAYRAPLSGNYTIGAGGNYASLSAVAGALSVSALSGNCIFEFTSAYAGSEMYPITLNQVPGCDANNYNIIVRPQVGASVLMTAANDILRLSGIDRITLDGRPGGVGTNRAWEMKTTGGGVAAIQFMNDASNDTVKFLRLETRTANNIVLTASIIAGATGNDNNGILNCFLTSLNSSIVPGQQPGNGVVSSGNGTAQNDGVSILDNDITNFAGAGIYCSTIGSNCTISGNHIYNSYPGSSGNMYGVYFLSNGGGHTVSNNYIGGTAPFAGGAAWSSSVVGILAIDFNASQGFPSTITNNTISNINLTSTFGVFAGINIGSPGSGGLVTCSGNTVGSLTSLNNIVFNSSNPGGGINCGPTGTIPISFINNTVANITHTNTGASQLYGIKCMNTPTYTITGNLVKNLTSHSTLSNNFEAVQNANLALVGLIVGGSISVAQTVSNNTITGLRLITTTATNPTVCGIGFDGGTGTATGNRIYDLTNTATGTATLPGILGINSRYFFGSNRTLSNNMVALSNGSNTNAVKIFGLSDEITANVTTFNYFFNSVLISGTATGAARSSAYVRQVGANGSGTTINFRNNIFYNIRTGGTGKHYAMINTSGSTLGWSASASNFNNLYTIDPSTLGAWPLATDKTFATWKSTSGGDASSKNVITSFFDITSDLHLNSYTNGALSNAATPVAGITVDFDNQAGNRTTTPDIGADEFTYLPPSCNTSFTKPYCPGTPTGTATIAIGNGGAPFTYLWSNAQTTSTAVGLLPASYSVTVTDTTVFTICNSTVVVPDSVDVTPPAINCPSNTLVQCASDTTPTVTGFATAIDDCTPPVTISYSDVVSVQACANSFSVSRTWFATDAVGNLSYCTQTIVVNDNTPPVIVCPAAITINCQDSQSPSNTGSATATDLCDNAPVVSYTDVTTSGICPGNYTINRTWTATDNCNNASTCVQVITVQDVTAPVIVCPSAITINCNDSQNPSNTGSATATDLCDNAPAVSYTDVTVAGNCPGNYTINRTWTATDNCNNASTCVQVITVQDVTAPVIVCPSAITINCNDSQSPSNTGSATATDLCDNAPAITYVDATTSGICPGNYTINRTWTATDNCNNASTCVQVITVQDVTAPAIVCPAAITINCQDSQSPSNTGSATATDLCDNAPVITYVDATVAGNCPGNYTINRTWTATDNCNNSSTCVQVITVQDVTAPVIVCPAAITINCNDSQSPSNTGSATATDLCDNAPAITYVDATVAGNCPGNYTINRTWTATDNCNNASTCVQVITVQDVTAPVIICPSAITINCNDSQSPSNTGSATATDLCDNAPVITYVDATVAGNCPGNYTIIRTWTATDNCNNASTCVQVITVQDVTASVIVCPAAITINCNDSQSPSNTGSATATDLCDNAPVITYVDATVAGNCPGNYTINRTWTATDNCNNASTCVQVITVQDVTAPVIVCPAAITINCNDSQSPSNTGSATATDLCDNAPVVSYTDVTVAGNCPGNYTINRTWTATDNCNNASTCVQVITVQDVTAPVIVCPAAITINCQDSQSPSNTGSATATDVCDNAPAVSYSDVTVAGNCPGNYTINRTWTATDNCNNASTCVQVITVLDVTAPVITCASDTSITINTGCTANVILNMPVVSDNCGSPSITNNAPLSFPIGTTSVIWTATDACNNISTCVQLVTVTTTAIEICNGIDDDCDGLTDDADPSVTGQPTWYADADGDGFGNPSVTITACNQPSGYVANSNDCNDANAAVNPGAAEICNGIDDDCDGLTDDADPSVTGQPTWYADADGDGFGNPAVTTTACVQPSGYVANSNDCNDANASVNPGATEICNGIDDDCDGLTDDADPSVTGQPTWYADADGDGFGNPAVTVTACSQPSGYVSNSNDCNDANAAVNPGAAEVCNGIDDDCDGLTDDADPSVTGQPTWYADADGDGFGNPAVTTTACVQPSGYVSNSNDCNDANASVNPGASEVCNGIDDDCDGLTDDADPSVTGQPTWYADADGDGFGNPAVTTTACTQPSGYVANSNDCNDANAAVDPGAIEICNGIDDDCDGLTDDADPSVTGQPTWYADADGDGFGNPAVTLTACNQPSGYVGNDLDCDDTNFNVHPNPMLPIAYSLAVEICNGIDDDCDGLIDAADPDVIGLTQWFADSDGDTFGNPASSVFACNQPTGYVSNNTDCNDNNANVNPGATELCNGIDDNCNGTVDEGCGGCGLTCSTTQVNATYWHAPNGSATVTPSGGTAPYSYSWNTPSVQTTATATGLSARAIGYTVTITDANGCTASCTVYITEPPYSCGNLTEFTDAEIGGWGAPPNGGNITNTWLYPYFATVFPNGITIGGFGRTLKFNCAQTITNYLPASATPAQLPNANYINPVGGNNPTFPVIPCGVNGVIYKNTLASKALALTLNVEFDRVLPNFSPLFNVTYGDLVYTAAPFAGWTVNQVLAEANRLLGEGLINGQTSTYYTTVSNVITNIVAGLNEQCPVNSPIRLADPNEVTGNIYSLGVYPNPAISYMHVDFNAFKSEPCSIRLIDMLGKTMEVYSGTTVEGENSIDLNFENLSKGLYILQLSVGETTLQHRIILQ